ncbi:MAG: penicillin-binding protein [Anaerolineae bacterium]
MTSRKFVLISLSLLAALALGYTALARRLLVDLPDPGRLYQYVAAPSTKIYDRNGVLLYEIIDPHQGSHTPLALADIPPACRQATIATEDATFYQNPGVEVKAIARALYTNLRSGQILSGGSTITQQLARNLLLSPQERTQISLNRKLREAILAWRIARRYSKDEILTLYLNETYYGNLAYGLEAASRTYFGKRAAELDLAECALLAGLPQSPARYNPLQDPAAAKTRQAVVLGLMVGHGYLSREEAELARQEPLRFAATPFPIKAPHFVMYVYGQLEKQFGLEAIFSRGLEVQTTLDLSIQNAARRATRFRLAQLEQRTEDRPPRNVRNAAVVVLNPNSGEVLAMLGSPDYFDRRIDGAVNVAAATRQPGSSIKPITYAAAFDPNLAATYGYAPLTPATMMADARTAFVTREGDPYVPQNYDRRWRGPVLLRQALASSMNLVAVKVLDHVGLEAMTGLARSLGITTFDDSERFGLALTLGGGEVRLLELTGAYAAFANGGRRVEPATLLRVTDAAGNVLLQRKPAPGQQALDPRAAYLITDILSDNYARAPAFGQASPLRLSGDRPAAVKTGTTTDFRDNWTVGYTPDFVVGVWAGNADNKPMRYVSGISGAAPIWRDVMEVLHQTRPTREFTRPAGLVELEVCADSGLLPVAGRGALRSGSASVSDLQDRPLPCPHTILETFIEGTQPAAFDDWHLRVALDRRSGLRASATCPPEVIVYRRFVRYPVEARAWAAEQGLPQPPEAYSPLCPGEENDFAAQAGSRESGVGGWGLEAIHTGPGQIPNPQSPAPGPRSPIPGLIFTAPDQGATFRMARSIPAQAQKLRVSVRPADDITLQTVRLFIDGQVLAEGPQALWQMTPGTHTFTAEGLDTQGNVLPGESVTIEVLP